jgi:hypothetical protein
MPLDSVTRARLSQVVQALRASQRSLLRRSQAGPQAVLAGAWANLRGLATPLHQEKRQCIGTA